MTSPILYACVATGPTILADLAVADDDDLRPLAGRCLAATPPFHRLYTQTASGLTYAFLIDDRLVFFAIAHASLSRPDTLLFLSRLRDSSLAIVRSRLSGTTLSSFCFQDELIHVLRRLVSPDLPHEKPPPPPSPASPPSDAPLTGGTPSGSDDGGRERAKKGKKTKKYRRDDAESRMDISLDPGHHENLDHGMGIGARNSAHKLWRRHVWMILLFDLVVCSILFVIWLSVCRGFQCIAG